MASFADAQKAFAEAREAFIKSEIATANAFLEVADTQVAMGKMERFGALLEKSWIAQRTAVEQLNAVCSAKIESGGRTQTIHVEQEVKIALGTVELSERFWDTLR
jgi:hypothetical protein